jgi:hypothetical protein
MKDPEKMDDHFIRLTGKGNIPQGLEIGHNYKVVAQGSITTKTESDKDDGSHSINYKFEPVLVEVVDDLGKSIKAKDTRSHSQLFRARVWKCWSKTNNGMSFDDYYGRLMMRLIQQADEVCGMYGE